MQLLPCRERAAQKAHKETSKVTAAFAAETSEVGRWQFGHRVRGQRRVQVAAANLF